MSKTKTNKVSVEFYLLFSDHSWDTIFIDVPEHLIFRYNETDSPNEILDWAHNHHKFAGDIWKIGIYSISSMEEKQ